MERITVTLDEENVEYIKEQSCGEGDFENESAVVDEAVRRMRTVEEEGVGAYKPLEEVHQELRENGELREETGGDGQSERERASIGSSDEVDSNTNA